MSTTYVRCGAVSSAGLPLADVPSAGVRAPSLGEVQRAAFAWLGCGAEITAYTPVGAVAVVTMTCPLTARHGSGRTRAVLLYRHLGGRVRRLGRIAWSGHPSAVHADVVARLGRRTP